MNKLFNRIFWKNNSVPALNEANLNAMSKALDDIDNRIINLPVVVTDEAVKKAEEVAEKAEEVANSIPSDYRDLTAKVDNIDERVTNRNLLDNPWFTVNQRGATTINGNATTQYGADRWIAYYGQVVFSENGVTFKGNTTAIIDQILNSTLDGTYTLSVLIDGQIHSLTFEISNQETVGYWPIGESHLQVQIFNALSVRLYNGDNAEDITVRAFKLEKGSKSTLSMDTVPNYADELLKCQGSVADATDTYANRNYGSLLTFRGSLLPSDNPKNLPIGVYSLERTDYSISYFPNQVLYGNLIVLGSSALPMTYGSYILEASGALWMGHSYKYDNTNISWHRLY